MCVIHHLAFLLPGALSHCSSTNAIKLLQSDLPDLKRSFGIHTRTQKKPPKPNQNYRIFSIHFGKYFLSCCWSCDCLVYSAVLKGLSGIHRGRKISL